MTSFIEDPPPGMVLDASRAEQNLNMLVKIIVDCKTVQTTFIYNLSTIIYILCSRCSENNFTA